MRGNSHVRFLEGLGGRKVPRPTRLRVKRLDFVSWKESRNHDAAIESTEALYC